MMNRTELRTEEMNQINGGFWVPSAINTSEKKVIAKKITEQIEKAQTETEEAEAILGQISAITTGCLAKGGLGLAWFF